MNPIAKSWIVADSAALLVAAAVGSPDAVVVAAAGGVAGLGAIAMVALLVPGSWFGTIAVMPCARVS